MGFESNGMLVAGFHEYSITDFQTMFVDEFASSQRRQIIFDALVEFLGEIFSVGIPHEIWIDGSFATSKVNPNDADLVLFLNYDDMVQLYPRAEFLRAKYPLLDIYFSVATSEETKKRMGEGPFWNAVNQRNYWRGQFGFDRSDRPKGIIRLSPASVKDYLEGGAHNVVSGN